MRSEFSIISLLLTMVAMAAPKGDDGQTIKGSDPVIIKRHVKQ